jgi:hypothetical protein
MVGYFWPHLPAAKDSNCARFLGIDRPIDGPQLGGDEFAFLPAAEAEAVTHQMDNAGLHLGLREHRLDGFGKAFEAIHHGDQDVLHAAVAQFGQHLEPELGPFIGLDPQVEHLLLAVGPKT